MRRIVPKLCSSVSASSERCQKMILPTRWLAIYHLLMRTLALRIGVIIGFILLGLSLVSFVIPVLPTVPLLILTCSVFARASPRWHAWLLDNRRLGPPLRLWQSHGAIELRVKLTTSLVMSGCLAYPLFFGKLSTMPRLWITLCTVSVLTFLWTRPAPPRRARHRAILTKEDSL